jgi:hypothetical protein
MIRIFLMLLLAAACVSHGMLCSAEPPESNLIRAQPSFPEASSTTAPAQDPSTEVMPTPREQMYVFWLLGKVLSYPVDTAESYISGMWRKWQSAPVVQPASAPAVPNPFDSMSDRHIPPAPPATSGSGAPR